jgi:hypothetical protein
VCEEGLSRCRESIFRVSRVWLSIVELFCVEHIASAIHLEGELNWIVKFICDNKCAALRFAE